MFKKIIFSLVLILFLFSCVNFGVANDLGSKKEAQEFPYKLLSKRIVISGPINVYLVNGLENKASMANEKILANLVSYEKDGIMYIETKPNFFPHGLGRFDLIIAINTVEYIKIETDRRFYAKEELKTESLELEFAGSTWGDITSKINNLVVISSSPKMVKLRGMGKTLKVIASDLARINIKSYQATTETIQEEIGAVIWK